MSDRCCVTKGVIFAVVAVAQSFVHFGRVDANPVDYVAQIKPLLAEKCYACHGRLKQEAGLRLETRAMMVESDVIVPGSPNESELLRRVTARGEERMPPLHEGAAFKSNDVQLLRRWIAEGAIAPDEDVPASPLEHWAFQEISRPAIPGSDRGNAQGSNPIDAFLNEQRQFLSLQVQPEGDRRIVLRRVYVDLIGLPPTMDQLNDPRPWHEIVDELLASPHHGERWGRHWMDVWRYSDWYGLGAQLRYSQKHIWHWRDWIIESLNQDKGYDQMIREMLAADEFSPLDADAIRATGFLARNYYLFNRTTWLDSTIEHTGKAFLGLTLNCAKCHDHKYDPITHVDYYNMRAIFEPHQVRLDPMPGVTDFEQDGLPRVFDDHVDAETFIHLRGNPKTLDKETQVVPGVPAFLSSFQPTISPVDLPLQAYAPGTRDYVLRDKVRAATAELDAAREKIAAGQSESDLLLAKARLALAEVKVASLAATGAADGATYRVGADRAASQLLATTAATLQAQVAVQAAKLKVVEAADDHKKRNIASDQLKKAEENLAAARRGEVRYKPIRGARKALESPAHKEVEYPEAYSSVSTGRRRALALWITSKQNPLTARVAVNHVWARHFGEPLVESMFDFGLRTPQPRNHKLLDYLAYEFMESGWSFRHLHRLMVNSQTYRLTSSSKDADSGTQSADPNNQFYWRMNTRRMESQVVRDSLLSLAGELETTLFGPPLEANGESKRRSLYFKHSRDDQNKFLKMFDDADLFQCYRRNESIVPQQALALANSKLVLKMSEAISRRLSEDDPELSRVEFVRRSFVALLARLPSEEEVSECVRFFAELDVLSGQTDEQRCRARFVHALLNHNDFITIR